MNDTTGANLLEFQDDYFASNISSDENVDDVTEHNILNTNDDNNNSNADQTDLYPSLHRSSSIVNISSDNASNTGIMFSELRVLPTSRLSLENANLHHFKNNRSNTVDDITSIAQGDDTLSTLFSPTPISVTEQEDQSELISNIDPDEQRHMATTTGYPFEFTRKLEFSDDSDTTEEFFNKKQHFFILSSAGKPIYSMHGSHDIFVVYSGIIQTIVSFYKYSTSGSESIKLIESIDVKTGEPIKLAFLDKSPIILMTIIRSNQSTYIELEQQLDFIYSFIISTLSKPYIDKIFNKYANFDLRNLLGQADLLTLDSICEGLVNNLNISQIFGGLQCLRMHSSIRSRLERKLMDFKSENLLYGLIVGPNGKLISIMRPRRHTLHTSDLMILFEMIFNTNTFKSCANNDSKNIILTTNEIFWVPICLPKFNSSGHLYNLIQFHQLKDERLFKLHDIEYDENEELDDDNTKIGIILMSPYKESFNDLRKISSEISRTILLDKKIYRDIWNSLVGSGRIIVSKTINNRKVTKSNSKINTSDDDNKIGRPKLGFSSLINLLPLSSSSKDNLSINQTFATGNIIHFAVKSRKLVQCIFPESEHFNVHDKIIKGNLLSVYKFLRRRLQILMSDSVVYGLDGNNESIVMEDEDFNDTDNTVVYEDWIDKENDEHLVGFGCRFGCYDVFIIGKGLMQEKEMLAYGLKIVKWCKKQDSRLFISSGCIF